MIGFFRKKPALGVSFFLALFFTGGVFARQLDKLPLASRSPLMLVKKTLSSAKSPAEQPWPEPLNIDRAQVKNGRLTQVMSDGTEVQFTIDPSMQSWAKKYLSTWQLPYAAMVMMEVSSGKVLVMAGHSARSEQVDTAALCLAPWAPAASVYKLVTAAALLENGLSIDEKVCYHGGLHGIEKEHLVDNPRDTTCRNLEFGIAQSVNPILAKLALKHLSRSQMEEWSHRFGFNRSIPFELQVKQSKAEIPSPELERARVAAGFWHTEASPLHGALIAEIGATRGVLRWPRVVETVVDKRGERKTLSTRTAEERVMSPEAAEKLARMMIATTKSGTAQRSFVPRRGQRALPGAIEVAGKTGSLSRKNPFLHYNWFVGFAPADNPQVAFAVLVGNPVAWKVKAHAAARSLLDQYFAQSATRSNTQLTTRVATRAATPRGKRTSIASR